VEPLGRSKAVAISSTVLPDARLFGSLRAGLPRHQSMRRGRRLEYPLWVMITRMARAVVRGRVTLLRQSRTRRGRQTIVPSDPSASDERSLKLFTSILDDAKLLPHFLRHYASAGISEFYIAAPSRFADDIDRQRRDYRITHLVADHSLGNVARNEIRTLRDRYQQQDEWVVIADLDEFIAFPDAIGRIIVSAEAEKANVVTGVMYDRFSADGLAVDFEPSSDLAERYPVKTRFIRDVMLGMDHKAVLVKGRLKASRSEHHKMVRQKAAATILDIDHYKWTAGSVDRLKARCLTLREAGTDWVVEYERAVKHYETYGRFAWEQFGGKLAGD
jgi:hypothetical protein